LPTIFVEIKQEAGAAFFFIQGVESSESFRAHH
jgi:hypothetical protein